MIDIESKIVSYREDTDDYRLCLTREEIDEIKDCRADAIDGINKIIQFIKDNSFNHKLECDSFKAIGSSVVIELLEQLKEE